MKKVSLAKSTHLGLSVCKVTVGGAEQAFAYLPAHVEPPSADTEKKDFIVVGTPRDLLQFLKSKKINEKEAFEIFPGLQNEMATAAQMSFVEKRYQRHVDSPNPLPSLAEEDEKILNEMRGSFKPPISFDDFVNQSKKKAKKNTHKKHIKGVR